MRLTPLVTSALILILALVVPAAAGAQSEPPVIHRVTLQPETGLLTIAGTGLGADLLVTLDGQPISVLPGATATLIDALVPPPVLATPGTYRLTLVDPVRRTGDGFVVAIAPGGGLVTSGAPADGAAGTVTPATRPEEVRTAAGVDRVGLTPALAGVSPKLFEGAHSTAVGVGALASNTTGDNNTAIGATALNRNTSGSANAAVGSSAMFNNMTGIYNAATGYAALFSNTNGGYNTATGAYALYLNSTGGSNTATGALALRQNLGSQNTATGVSALYNNTAGNSNTASGFEALVLNTTGSENVASGFRGLYSNSTGSLNAASGAYALFSNTSGDANTASGRSALHSNTTGFYNTASGVNALLSNTSGNGNDAYGAGALNSNTTGSNNVAVGFNAGSLATTGSYNVYLGNNVPGTAADSNTMRLGLPYNGTTGVGQNQTFVAGIYATTLTAPALQVFVDANGRLGTLGPAPIVGSIAGGVTPGSFEQLLEAQQATITELQAALAALRDRLARLETAGARRR